MGVETLRSLNNKVNKIPKIRSQIRWEVCSTETARYWGVS